VSLSRLAPSRLCRSSDIVSRLLCSLHRIAVFRDDIIFFIYLYQRWIYPVDKARRNEFGSSAEDYELVAARQRGERRASKRAKLERR
jgi:hypothetical protein